MHTARQRPGQPLTRFEWTLVAIQSLAMGVLGTIALLDADDPDWGGLQRLVVLMMLGLWTGGIVLSVVVARALRRRWLRATVLLIGPFVGLAIVVVRSAFGWT